MPRALRKIRKANPGDLRAVVDETIALYHRLMWVADQIHEHGGAVARRGILRGLLRYGAQTVPDLARARAVKRQSIQPVVDELASEGLVVLEANPNHRTSKLVRITDAGAAIVERMDRADRRVLNAVGRDLDRADIEVTAATLRGLRTRFETTLRWRGVAFD